MKAKTLKALLNWAAKITESVQETNPGHADVLQEKFDKLYDALSDDPGDESKED